MKFEDMQKIWNEESGQHFYIIDQEKVKHSILNKSQNANHWVDVVEKILLCINFLCPLILISISFIKHNFEWPTYLMALFMILTGIYILIKRKKRILSNNNWSKSMLGSLNEAINNATYQANLTNNLRIWYLLGVASISIISLINDNTSIWIIIMMIVFFILTFFLAKWEQKAIYNKKRDELISIKKKFTE